MSCNNNKVFNIEPGFRKIQKPVGVEYGEPYYLTQVPSGMADDNVNYTTERVFTNVRGYGNIITYREIPNQNMVEFHVQPWNR